MNDNTDGFEYPDEAGYPDGAGFLSETQHALIDEVQAPQPETTGIDFFVVNNEAEGSYQAVSGDTLIGGITYERSGDVVTLIATSVFPEFRHQGVASELIRRVLDTIRAEGARVTIGCPVVRTFLRKHPEYAELVA
ncbi:GNAT family N-acetyltransferase [Leifsonia sp. 2MCAF36]|uniref:GNAT family N-acetyltransferase n=1 Tax=Leifsonia sp. 2MCAF36 TaxID=3232988 RepID=UPI003F94E166